MEHLSKCSGTIPENCAMRVDMIFRQEKVLPDSGSHKYLMGQVEWDKGYTV